MRSMIVIKISRRRKKLHAVDINYVEFVCKQYWRKEIEMFA